LEKSGLARTQRAISSNREFGAGVEDRGGLDLLGWHLGEERAAALLGLSLWRRLREDWRLLRDDV